MQRLDIAVTVRPAHLGGPVLNLLQLQEQLVGMMVRVFVELTPVVRQKIINLRLLNLEER